MHRKVCHKSSHPFTIKKKCIRKVRIEEAFLNLMRNKSQDKNPDSCHWTYCWKMDGFSSILGQKQGCLLSPLQFDTLPETLVMQESKKKCVSTNGYPFTLPLYFQFSFILQNYSITLLFKNKFYLFLILYSNYHYSVCIMLGAFSISLNILTLDQHFLK